MGVRVVPRLESSHRSGGGSETWTQAMLWPLQFHRPGLSFLPLHSSCECCVEAALLCATWTAILTNDIYVSDLWESCILPTWLMESVLLQHCPCGQLTFLFPAQLDAIPTAWNFFSNWQVVVHLLRPRQNALSILKPSFIFVHRKLFPFSHFLKLKLGVSHCQHRGSVAYSSFFLH